MQQTSGSSSCCRTNGDDDFDVDVAVDEVALDEVAAVDVAFLFMVCGNCKQLLFVLIGGLVDVFHGEKRTRRRTHPH
jgi:hypothetical protein